MTSALGLRFSSALQDQLKPWRPIHSRSCFLSSAREALLVLALSLHVWALVVTGGLGCLAWSLLHTATQVRGLLWGPVYPFPAPSSPWGSQQLPPDWPPASPPDTHCLCPLRLPRAIRANLGKLNQDPSWLQPPRACPVTYVESPVLARRPRPPRTLLCPLSLCYTRPCWPPCGSSHTPARSHPCASHSSHSLSSLFLAASTRGCGACMAARWWCRFVTIDVTPQEGS